MIHEICYQLSRVIFMRRMLEAKSCKTGKCSPCWKLTLAKRDRFRLTRGQVWARCSSSSPASGANDRPLFRNSPLSPFPLLLENATYANIIFLFQSIWRNTLRKNAIQEHLELMIVHKDPSSPRPHLFFPWSVLFLISHFCIISTTFWQFSLNLDISY